MESKKEVVRLGLTTGLGLLWFLRIYSRSINYNTDSPGAGWMRGNATCLFKIYTRDSDSILTPTFLSDDQRASVGCQCMHDAMYDRQSGSTNKVV